LGFVLFAKIEKFHGLKVENRPKWGKQSSAEGFKSGIFERYTRRCCFPRTWNAAAMGTAFGLHGRRNLGERAAGMGATGEDEGYDNKKIGCLTTPDSQNKLLKN